MHGIPEIDGLLEVEPKLWLSVREPGKPQCRVRRDCPLSVHNLIHPWVGYPEPLSRFLLSDSQGNQEVLKKDEAWVDTLSVEDARRVYEYALRYLEVQMRIHRFPGVALSRAIEAAIKSLHYERIMNAVVEGEGRS